MPFAFSIGCVALERADVQTIINFPKTLFACNLYNVIITLLIYPDFHHHSIREHKQVPRPAGIILLQDRVQTNSQDGGYLALRAVTTPVQNSKHKSHVSLQKLSQLKTID